MQKELNHKVRKCFNEGIYNVARYTEIVLSIIILIVIALAGIRLIFTITRNTDHGHGHRFLYNISCKWVISGSRS